MKIGYFADGPWAHKALDALLDNGVKIAFIVPRFDTQDPILKEMSNAIGADWIVEKDVNSALFINKLKSYCCDVFVSMSFNQIIKADLVSLAPLGFINCHAGSLPFYRGRNPLNWAIINGEKRVGVTVHYIDEGIDTGDIIQQDFVVIESSDNYSTVLAKAYSQCALTLIRALEKLKMAEAVGRPQTDIDKTGFYCGQRRWGDEYIDWSWPSQRIHDFIRGITTPGPGARSRSHTKYVAIFGSELIPAAPSYIGIPGEVVGRSARGSVVKTGDSTLLLVDLADVLECGKMSERYVPKFRIGTRLGLTYGDLINHIFGE
jgi:methionyl-tRNA formyltransferase